MVEEPPDLRPGLVNRHHDGYLEETKHDEHETVFSGNFCNGQSPVRSVAFFPPAVSIALCTCISLHVS